MILKPIKLLIAGSRKLINDDYWLNYLDGFNEKLESHGYIVAEEVCGLAKGADNIGKKWAERNNITVKEFPALWDDLSEPCALRYRRDGTPYNAAAGPKRNAQMGDYADIGIVIYYPSSSKGSMGMIKIMKKLNKPVYEVKLD